MRKGEIELDESFFGTEPEKKVDGSKIKEKDKKRKRKGNNEPNASAMEAELELANQQVKREKLKRNKEKMKEKIENGYNGGTNLQINKEKPEKAAPTEEKKVAAEVAADEKVISEKEEIVEKSVDAKEENSKTEEEPVKKEASTKKIEEEPNKEESSTQEEEKPEVQAEKPDKTEKKQLAKEEESEANIEESGEPKHKLRSKDGKKIVLVLGKHGEESGLKPDEVYFGDLSEEEQKAIDNETIRKEKDSRERIEKRAKEKAEEEAAALAREEEKARERKRLEEEAALQRKEKEKKEEISANASAYSRDLARPEDAGIDYSKAKKQKDFQQQLSQDYLDDLEKRNEERKEMEEYAGKYPSPELQQEFAEKNSEAMKMHDENKVKEQGKQIEGLNKTVETAKGLIEELNEKLAKTEQELAEMKRSAETERAAVAAEKNLSQKAKEGIKNFFTKHKTEKLIVAGLIGSSIITGPMGIATGAAVGWMNYKTRKEVERIQKETKDIIEKTGYVPPAEPKKGLFDKIKGFGELLDTKITFDNGTKWPQLEAETVGTGEKKPLEAEKEETPTKKTKEEIQETGLSAKEERKKEQAKNTLVRFAKTIASKFRAKEIGGEELLIFTKQLEDNEKNYGTEVIKPAVSVIYTEKAETRGAMVDAMVEYAKTQKMKPEEVREYMNYFETTKHTGSIENYKWLMGEEAKVEVKEEIGDQKNRESESGRVYKLSAEEYGKTKRFFGEIDKEEWNEAMLILINTISKDFPLMPEAERIGNYYIVSDPEQPDQMELVMQTLDNKEVIAEIGFNDKENGIIIKNIITRDLPKKEKPPEEPPAPPEKAEIEKPSEIQKEKLESESSQIYRLNDEGYEKLKLLFEKMSEGKRKTVLDTLISRIGEDFSIIPDFKEVSSYYIDPDRKNNTIKITLYTDKKKILIGIKFDDDAKRIITRASMEEREDNKLGKPEEPPALTEGKIETKTVKEEKDEDKIPLKPKVGELRQEVLKEKPKEVKETKKAADKYPDFAKDVKKTLHLGLGRYPSETGKIESAIKTDKEKFPVFLELMEEEIREAKDLKTLDIIFNIGWDILQEVRLPNGELASTEFKSDQAFAEIRHTAGEKLNELLEKASEAEFSENEEVILGIISVLRSGFDINKDYSKKELQKIAKELK